MDDNFFESERRREQNAAQGVSSPAKEKKSRGTGFAVVVIVLTVIAAALIVGLTYYFFSTEPRSAAGDDDIGGFAPYSELTWTSPSDGLTDEGFFIGGKASDLVTLHDYRSIKLPESYFTADPDAVREQLEYYVFPYYEDAVFDRPIEDGDTVNIDYVGSVDGVEFEGGSTDGAGVEVTIGVTNYIDGFLPQLVGHMPGDNFDITVTFPDPYDNDESLSGKEAVFNITVNYVLELPDELTEDMAEDWGFESKEEMLEFFEERVVRDQRIEFIDKLISETEFEEIPASVRRVYENYVIIDFEEYYGYDLSEEREEFLAFYDEEYGDIDDLAKEAIFALAIAEKEGLTISDDYIADFDVEDSAESYGLPFVKNQLIAYRLIPEFLAENAKR